MNAALSARYSGTAGMNGSDRGLECGPLGDLLSSPLGDYYEIARRGMLFHAETAVTGVAPGTAIGTTGAFTLSNPLGSPVDLVILEGSMGYVSGTLGIGRVDWLLGALTDAAPSGTAIAALNARIGGRASFARPLTTSTITAPTLCRPFATLPPLLASSVLAPWVYRDAVNGAIVVSPGSSVTLHATAAAGTSPLVVFGCMWAEVSALS